MIISLGLVHGTAKAMLRWCILLLSDKLAEVLHLRWRRIANVAWHLLISITWVISPLVVIIHQRS